MPRIFAYIAHRNGTADDTAAELAAAAKAIDANASPIAIVAGCGAELQNVCESLCASFAEVWKLDSEALSYPNAELVREAITRIVPPGNVVLVAHEHFGIDLAPGLSIKLAGAYCSDVIGIASARAAYVDVVRQEFGGQVCTHVRCDISGGAVLTIRPGAFKPDVAPVGGSVIDKAREVGALSAKRRYLETIEPEAGDVDITRHAVLVSVGRGIQDAGNIGLAEELAEALGGAVSCSRPVVDAKWLPKARQVGSSGKTVKPKVYIACGISGAFQHLVGIKGSPFLVAINKNPKAPIFQVADVGIVADILEFLPQVTNKVRELRAVGTK